MKSVLILGAAAALLASCSSQSKTENSSAVYGALCLAKK